MGCPKTRAALDKKLEIVVQQALPACSIADTDTDYTKISV